MRAAWCPWIAAVTLVCAAAPAATPRIPPSASEALAQIPAGARHQSIPPPAITAGRIDVALPLAQFEIARARATGDLRFLGYAEAVLAPWMRRDPVSPDVLVLHATILQSRHEFGGSLAELDRALNARPQDAQAWLTRATVLRVLGRYPEAETACGHLTGVADPVVADLCAQSLHGLTGHLRDAYRGIESLNADGLAPEVRAWRYSELGEMAERLGDDAAAEHWLRAGLQVAPLDFYMRAACADVLLRQGRASETLRLLAGYESMEPMLLRLAIAHRALGDGAGAGAQALLSNAFDVERRRGDSVHRREQARYLLDVALEPAAALAAALQNWRVQHEPDDVLILLRAAHAAHRDQVAAEAVSFLERTGLEDSRLDPYRPPS